MTKRFNFNLKWEQAAIYWYPLLIINMLIVFVSFKDYWDTANIQPMGSMSEAYSEVVLSGLFMFAATVIIYIIGLLLIRKIMNSIHFGDISFKAEFSVWNVLGYWMLYFVYMIGIVLLGFAFAWLKVPIVSIVLPFLWIYLILLNTKMMVKYIFRCTGYDESAFAFKGTSKGLFIVYLKVFGLYLLSMIIIIPFMLLSGASFTTSSVYPIPIYIIFYALSAFIGSIMLLLFADWIINLKYKDYDINFNDLEFKDYLRFGGELTLGALTLGFYSPKAFMNITDLLLSKLNVHSGAAKFEFKFEGNTGEGYKLILIEGLLSLITLGIYSPFAIEKIYKWYFSKITAEKISLVNPVKALSSENGNSTVSNEEIDSVESTEDNIELPEESSQDNEKLDNNE